MGLMDDVKSKKKQKEAENWFNMGIKSQDPEKKLDYFTRSLELEPNNVSAWLKKGRILEDMGRFDEAKKSYDRATLLDPALDIRLKEENSFSQQDIGIQDKIREQAQYVQEEVQYSPNETDYLSENSEGKAEFFVEKGDQEIVSFTPPMGEESLFGNINKNEVFEEEEVKETNEMNIGSVQASEGISFIRPDEEIAYDNDVSEKNKTGMEDQTVTVDTSSETRTDNEIKREHTPAFDKKPAVRNMPVIEKEKKQIQPEKRRIPSYIEMEGKNARLYIPLSETLKFWLVGAIVLLMVYLITRAIG